MAIRQRARPGQARQSLRATNGKSCLTPQADAWVHPASLPPSRVLLGGGGGKKATKKWPEMRMMVVVVGKRCMGGWQSEGETTAIVTVTGCPKC